jgi:hypothetical protein
LSVYRWRTGTRQQSASVGAEPQRNGPPDNSIMFEKKPQYLGISLARNASRIALIVWLSSALPLVRKTLSQVQYRNPTYLARELDPHRGATSAQNLRPIQWPPASLETDLQGIRSVLGCRRIGASHCSGRCKVRRRWTSRGFVHRESSI